MFLKLLVNINFVEFFFHIQIVQVYEMSDIFVPSKEQSKAYDFISNIYQIIDSCLSMFI